MAETDRELDETIAALARAYRDITRRIGLLEERRALLVARFDEIAPVDYISQVDGILVRKRQGPNDPVPRLTLNGGEPR